MYKMETKWVATLSASKVKAVTRYMTHRFIVLLLMTSCAQNDDLGVNATESLIENETTIELNPPIATETPTNNNPPNNNEPHIIYTDIEPDYISTELNDFYELNLNNDGFVDFTLISSADSNEIWLGIYSTDDVNGIISVTPWYTYVVPLENGSDIFYHSSDSIIISYEVGALFEIGTNYYMPWINANDKYVGLRLFIDGKIHYGWARLSVTSITSWVIKDYAYNATPNSPILAGQTE